MRCAVEVKNLSKSFDGKTVLSDISLSFPAGSFTCIMGPSGCGKTTLLRIIAGLEKQDTGSVEKGNSSVSFVFQEDRLSESFSAMSNVRLVTGNAISREEIMSHFSEVGLASYADKSVCDFSGGMKRRLAIVRAVCFNADLILLDEPFKGLDDKLKNQVMDYVKRHTSGKTVICVTHDKDESSYLASSVIFLSPMYC